MNSKQIPEYITDYINGYCKKQTKLLIPFCLTKIIALYFIIHIQEILFAIKFKYHPTYISRIYSKRVIRHPYQSIPSFQTLTSISSTFLISNKCYKLIIHVGKSMDIEICLSKSIIQTQQQTFVIEATNGEQYKIDTNSSNNIEITFNINRKTACSCLKGDGNVELYIQQKQHSDTNNGYAQISLIQNFDYNSDENVSIETYDINEIHSISNENSSLPCGEFGFGRQCCFWAAYDHSNIT